MPLVTRLSMLNVGTGMATPIPLSHSPSILLVLAIVALLAKSFAFGYLGRLFSRLVQREAFIAIVMFLTLPFLHRPLEQGITTLVGMLHIDAQLRAKTAAVVLGIFIGFLTNGTRHTSSGPLG
jgi:hypothetical protein